MCVNACICFLSCSVSFPFRIGGTSPSQCPVCGGGAAVDLQCSQRGCWCCVVRARVVAVFIG